MNETTTSVRRGNGATAPPGGSAIDVDDPDALAHSERLAALIADRVADGRSRFSEYMAQALYEPGLGYYMAGATRFGATGDFITAPEITPLFGASLAVQCREVLPLLDNTVFEFGAGSGALAASLCQALGRDTDFRYCILEPSADLQARQRDRLSRELSAPMFERIHWLDRLPEQLVAVVLANEVLDAMPVERFRIDTAGRGDTRARVQEAHVRVDESGGLGQRWQAASKAVADAVADIESDLPERLPSDYESEVCLFVDPWLRALSNSLERGLILLIDYGYPRAEYYLPERNRGTLRCHLRHHALDDPYHRPGLQDITAHVDFTQVAASAERAGLSLLGYASQAAFLLGNELLTLAENARAAASREMDRVALNQAIKRLTLPGEMGERFQVMALGKTFEPLLRGFHSQDLSYRL